MPANTKSKTVFSDEVEHIVDELVLFDDDFMRVVFQNNKECIELILKIVLEDDSFEVAELSPQKEIASLESHSVKLDFYVKDQFQNHFDLEIHRINGESNEELIKRTRYYNAIEDINALPGGLKYRNLPSMQIIFILDSDFFGKNTPFYDIDRTVTPRLVAGAENNLTFSEYPLKYEDDVHILYVNGQYNGNDPVGHLMHDLNTKKPEDMYYEPLKKAVAYVKNGKGRIEMCKIVEEYGEKTRLEGANNEKRSVISLMLSGGQTPQQINQMLHYPIELIQEVQATM